MAKLSPYCIACGDQHSVDYMSEYVARCIARGKDPLDVPRGGILCPSCVLRAIDDMSKDDNEAAVAVATERK